VKRNCLLSSIMASPVHALKGGIVASAALAALCTGPAATAQTVTPLAPLAVVQNSLIDTPLTFDPTGRFLYGEVFGGGKFGRGSLFALTPPTGGGQPWVMTTLFSFNKQGRNPAGGLTLDPNSGVFYGVTANGGPHVTNDGKGNGTVFRFDPAGPAPVVSTILNFNGNRGSDPRAAPALDASGDLIGATYAGGGGYNPNATTTNGSGTFPTGSISGAGVVYSLTPPTAGKQWPQTVLRKLLGEPNRSPSGPLLLGASGDYYGVTQHGGKNGSGSVFALHKTGSSWTFKTIYSFRLFDGEVGAGTDGYQPTGALVQDAAGNLYGTTLYGGSGGSVTGPDGGGTVFKLSPTRAGGWKETLIFQFGPTNGPVTGFLPVGGVTFVDGILYGVTQWGGPAGREAPGTIFSLTPPAPGHTDWGFNLLWAFSGTGADGGNPAGRLIADNAGNLYGSTTIGTTSPCHCGAIYKFTPQASPSVARGPAVGSR
jgi:hypothetical protein